MKISSLPVGACLILASFCLTPSGAPAAEATSIAVDFTKGDLGCWNADKDARVVDGRGVQAVGPVGKVSCPLDFPIAEAGKVVFKATIFPAEGSKSWIALGFYPRADKPGTTRGPVVLFRYGGGDGSERAQPERRVRCRVHGRKNPGIPTQAGRGFPV